MINIFIKFTINNKSFNFNTLYLNKYLINLILNENICEFIVDYSQTLSKALDNNDINQNEYNDEKTKLDLLASEINKLIRK